MDFDFAGEAHCAGKGCGEAESDGNFAVRGGLWLAMLLGVGSS